MTIAKIDQLGERVNATAAALARMRPSPDPIGDLVYPGGWLGTGWQYEVFRPEINCALLYEPRLLVHDPLAEYFFSDFAMLPETILRARGIEVISGARLWADHGRRVHRGSDLDEIRADLESVFGVLRMFEPLIRSGVMVMRSQFPTLERQRHALESSVRTDLRSAEMVAAVANAAAGLPRWDNITGFQAVPPGFDPDDPKQWEPEFYYLAKTLMFSSSAGAFYAPSSESELALLRAKSVDYLKGKRSLVPSQPLVQEVLRAVAPDLHLDPGTAVKIRNSEEAFHAWRRELRSLQVASVNVPDEDVPQLVQDMLQPKIDAVQAAVSKSAALSKRAGKNLGLALIAGAAAAPGGPVGVGVAAAATGIGGYLMDFFGRRRLDGSKPVIAALLHQSR